MSILKSIMGVSFAHNPFVDEEFDDLLSEEGFIWDRYNGIWSFKEENVTSRVTIVLETNHFVVSIAKVKGDTDTFIIHKRFSYTDASSFKLAYVDALIEIKRYTDTLSTLAKEVVAV